MQSAQRVFLVALLAFLVSACGTVSVAVQEGASLPPGARIAVVTDGVDVVGVVNQLERLLIEKGYNVTRLGSATHILNVGYTAYYDVFFSTHQLRAFFGRLEERQTGRVIASGAFSGNKDVTSVLVTFIEDLDRQIRNRRQAETS